MGSALNVVRARLTLKLVVLNANRESLDSACTRPMLGIPSPPCIIVSLSLVGGLSRPMTNVDSSLKRRLRYFLFVCVCDGANAPRPPVSVNDHSLGGSNNIVLTADNSRMAIDDVVPRDGGEEQKHPSPRPAFFALLIDVCGVLVKAKKLRAAVSSI